MLGGTALAHADGLTHDERNPGLSAKHVADLGSLVDQLVDRTHPEIGHAQIGDRARPGNRSSNRSPHDRVLGDRRVDDALGAELVDQPEILVGARTAMGGREVFTQRPDQRVAAHFLGQSFANGIGKGHLGHDAPPSLVQGSGGPKS